MNQDERGNELSPLRKIPVIAVTSGGRMLLVQRGSDNKYPWRWCIPGGKVERTDFSTLTAAHRELAEETGLMLEPGQLLQVAELPGVTRPDLVFHIFHVDLRSRPIIDLEGTFEGYGWFKKEETPGLDPMEPALWCFDNLRCLTHPLPATQEEEFAPDTKPVRQGD